MDRESLLDPLDAEYARDLRTVEEFVAEIEASHPTWEERGLDASI